MYSNKRICFGYSSCWTFISKGNFVIKSIVWLRFKFLSRKCIILNKNTLLEGHGRVLSDIEKEWFCWYQKESEKWDPPSYKEVKWKIIFKQTGFKTTVRKHGWCEGEGEIYLSFQPSILEGLFKTKSDNSTSVFRGTNYLIEASSARTIALQRFSLSNPTPLLYMVTKKLKCSISVLIVFFTSFAEWYTRNCVNNTTLFYHDREQSSKG